MKPMTEEKPPIMPLVSANGLNDWLHTATPGTRLCYFSGDLARARAHQQNAELRLVASIAMAASDRGAAYLTQRHAEWGQFDYFISKAARVR